MPRLDCENIYGLKIRLPFDGTLNEIIMNISRLIRNKNKSQNNIIKILSTACFILII